MNKKISLLAEAQDPIFIGTGGFTIGRVDNTIVRDPITRIPKIPGTSIAGVWRYYMALTLHSYFKEGYRLSREKRKEIPDEGLERLFNTEAGGWEENSHWLAGYRGNRYGAIRCAGQDEMPEMDPGAEPETDELKGWGHCGCCTVCYAFGYSKNKVSRRGMVYFSDLNILLFPVYTRFGTKWVTSKRTLDMAGFAVDYNLSGDGEVGIYQNGLAPGNEFLNLGWLNFKTADKSKEIKEICGQLQKRFTGFTTVKIQENDLVLVSDRIIQQIINSNLETRTSVAIDPLTGAAKERALFTSEAIPRRTIFTGEIGIAGHPLKQGPTAQQVDLALAGSKRYFETLGIGGMTTRGFGRLKVFDWGEDHVN